MTKLVGNALRACAAALMLRFLDAFRRWRRAAIRSRSASALR